MPDPLSSNEALLATLEDHLNREHYSSRTAGHHLATTKKFLVFLDKQRIAVSAVQPTTVERYLDGAQRRYRRLYGHPLQPERWRRAQSAGIHMLLRLLRGHWPPAPKPVTGFDLFTCEIANANRTR